MLRDLNNTIFSRIEALLPLLPLLARGVFATSLLIYFWTAGVTKLGPGVFGFLSPAPGAYIQILPRAMVDCIMKKKVAFVIIFNVTEIELFTVAPFDD